MLKETLVTLALQCAPTVHHDTMLDMAKVESGLNPFAIAVVTTPIKSYLPKNRQEAIERINALEKADQDYSIGLMQINRRNFNRFSVTGQDLLDPCTNMRVAEKIMVDCYNRGRSLKNALSCYYSGNFETGQKKEKAFSNTSYVERIAGKELSPTPKVIVPSTRELKQQKIKPKQIDSYAVIYPDYVVRGSVLPETIKGNEHE
ncbi:lytic transglycosylase domain-containing protein [Escherichia coli]|uniref:lytic transglycosylase domain-containing protein n=2 Tax=Enterobacteriaceae TaxID=543 RepID=UPI0028609E91|nr:lytic transglycosylase domain-containing protein [Escherichia coli]